MAKTKVKPDTKLYDKLRDSGVRKKVAGQVADALPRKGNKKPSRAAKVADQLAAAADSIRDRTGGGSRKRKEAAKKGARSRKAKAAKRRSSARKGAKRRAKA
jgi:hypothetical protein